MKVLTFANSCHRNVNVSFDVAGEKKNDFHHMKSVPTVWNSLPTNKQ